MKERLRDIAGKRRNISGWKKAPADPRDRLLSAPWYAGLTLPARASVRGSLGLKVEDQADIGSCVYNSSTTDLEFVLRKKGVDVQLSRLYGYARGRQFEGTPLTEDSGAYIRNAMKVLAKIGIPPESLWPYDLNKWQTDPPAVLDVEAAKYRALLYLRCPTLRTIKVSLASGFPVVGGFSVPENMFGIDCQTTGVVKFPGPSEGFEGGHAVLFTGYDDKTGWLEFINSWSEQWGNGGYGFLPYEFVIKGLADDFWTIRAAA